MRVQTQVVVGAWRHTKGENMAKRTDFHEHTAPPVHGHQKGQNAAGYHPATVQLETAPGRLGKAGYVRIKKA